MTTAEPPNPMCGRHPVGKDFLYRHAELVGGTHVSGLFARRECGGAYREPVAQAAPLADLVPCAVGDKDRIVECVTLCGKAHQRPEADLLRAFDRIVDAAAINPCA